MARKGYASRKDDWFKLLTNVLADAAKLPDMSDQTKVLTEVLAEARERGAQLLARKGQKQQETEEHRELMRRGEEAAGRIRATLRGHLGFRSQELAKYGVKPLDPKKRRQPGEPEEPEPEDSAQTPPGVQPAPQKPDPSPQKS